MPRIAISAGHGLKVRGAASDMLDEVDEARRITKRLGEELADRGVDVRTYWDDISTSQSENLRRITDWHNSEYSDLAVSVHINASEQTDKPMGCEVLYVTQKTLAAKVSAAIADSGLKDRGPKFRDDLYVLNETSAPAILLEVLFLDSTADVAIYTSQFDLICESVANAIGGEDTDLAPEPEPPQALFKATGKCSYFGGPADSGVSPEEGLAFIYKIEDAPHLFLPYQPEGSTGLARRLNSVAVNYVACRWDYSVTSKEMLARVENVALVRAVKTGLSAKAWPADWGPAGPESDHDTGRVADLSPCLMDALGIATDDEVTVIFPYREDEA